MCLKASTVSSQRLEQWCRQELEHSSAVFSSHAGFCCSGQQCLCRQGLRERPVQHHCNQQMLSWLTSFLKGVLPTSQTGGVCPAIRTSVLTWLVWDCKSQSSGHQRKHLAIVSSGLPLHTETKIHSNWPVDRCIGHSHRLLLVFTSVLKALKSSSMDMQVLSCPVWEVLSECSGHDNCIIQSPKPGPPWKQTDPHWFWLWLP